MQVLLSIMDNCSLQEKIQQVWECCSSDLCVYPETCPHAKVILSQKGVIFACPAQVYRAMYSGRGIIAPNTDFSPELVDSRGYLPVEWWIMSKTQAKNSVPVENEGRIFSASHNMNNSIFVMS